MRRAHGGQLGDCAGAADAGPVQRSNRLSSLLSPCAGPMEGSWATALALQTLDLSNNELSGPLPDAWGAPNGFRSLQRLQVPPMFTGAPCSARHGNSA